MRCPGRSPRGRAGVERSAAAPELRAAAAACARTPGVRHGLALLSAAFRVPRYLLTQPCAFRVERFASRAGSCCLGLSTEPFCFQPEVGFSMQHPSERWLALMCPSRMAIALRRCRCRCGRRCTATARPAMVPPASRPIATPPAAARHRALAPTACRRSCRRRLAFPWRCGSSPLCRGGRGFLHTCTQQ